MQPGKDGKKIYYGMTDDSKFQKKDTFEDGTLKSMFGGDVMCGRACNETELVDIEPM